MLKKLKLLGLTAGAVLALGAYLAPADVSAQLFDDAKGQACDALNVTNSTAIEGGDCGDTNEDRMNTLLTAILNIVSLVVGVIAVVMVVISGLKYITSQGESANVSSAKDTLLYAVIGIVVVVSAQVIVKFVLNRATTSPPPAEPATSLWLG